MQRISWRAVVAVGLTIMVLSSCGGPSTSEQALVAVALTNSERIDSVEGVEQIADQICSLEQSDEEAVVFATTEDAAIASVFCPDLAENAITRDEAYLAALDDDGVRSEFAADRAAIAAAERTCAELDEGAEAQGSEAQRIAIDWFCPAYSEAFVVLTIASVDGTFVLIDADERFATRCTGDGGYSDLNASTAVIVRDREGTELSRTDLGAGVGERGKCTFSFTLRDVSEGAPGDIYVLEVGDRGEISYSFLELLIPGAVALSIGD